MADSSLPTELLQARDQIDQIDQALIKLLADRFALTLQVGKIKASQKIESVDPTREAQKLEKLRHLSEELGLNPDLVAQLFTQIMEEAVKNHKRLKAELAASSS